VLVASESDLDYTGPSSEPQVLTVTDRWQAADANGDDRVDVADLGILATNYNRDTDGGRAAGDYNFDDFVNVADLGLLASHFGQGDAAADAAPAGSSFQHALAAYPQLPAVPEPTSLAGLLPALAALALRPRRFIFGQCEDRDASTKAYIDYMRPRCVELARVLKTTGSFGCHWYPPLRLTRRVT
jgi:hypothetical protein